MGSSAAAATILLSPCSSFSLAWLASAWNSLPVAAVSGVRICLGQRCHRL
jgi:hypothetical protein